MALQFLPHGLYLDVEADGTYILGEGIPPILVLTFVRDSTVWKKIGAPQHAIRTPQHHLLFDDLDVLLEDVIGLQEDTAILRSGGSGVP